MRILLNNVNQDDISEIFESQGGPAMCNVRATNFGGGTVTLQVASMNDPLKRFIPATNGTFFVDASVKIDYLPIGMCLKAVLSGATNPSDVYVDILQ